MRGAAWEVAHDVAVGGAPIAEHGMYLKVENLSKMQQWRHWQCHLCF